MILQVLGPGRFQSEIWKIVQPDVEILCHTAEINAGAGGIDRPVGYDDLADDLLSGDM